MNEVIDLSYANGKFDWVKARSMGVERAYLKSGQRNFPDPMFKINLESAPKEISLGSYHFLDYTLGHYQAGQEIEFGKSQASKTAEIVLPYLMTGKLGIWIWDGYHTETIRNATLFTDIEDNSGSGWEKITPQNIGRVLKIALAYKLKLESIIKETAKIDLKVGTYSNCSLVQSMANFKDGLEWLAWYTSMYDPGYVKKLSDGTVYYASGAWMGDWYLHQYSSRGDGQKYGNSVGNNYIDLNRVNSKWQFYKPQAQADQPPPAAEISDAEKLKILWQEHLDRKGG